MIRKQNPEKKKVSNLVKPKKWHMDAYDGTTTEQQVESLRKTLYLT